VTTAPLADPPAWSVAVSARKLAVGGNAGTITVFSLETGEVAHVLTGHEGPVQGLAWSDDGRRLVSGGADGTVRTWVVDEVAQEQYATPPLGQPVTCVAFSRLLVAAGGDDGAVWVLDPRGLARVAERPGHEGSVRALAFAPDGRTFATASFDGTVLIWESPAPP
jgi:WD40 repeat protein